ncbi:MAG TPA: urease accessory protein UreF [Flavisolibacter sp.]|nr:urease accessory protein UreF [Flavisolibacter sp.]
MTNSRLLSLLQLSDPTLPIGSFSHSAGLETYVQYGIVKDRKSAEDFIVAQLRQNLFYTDAAFVSLAYEAALKNDEETLLLLDEECTAVKLPREMRMASQKLGLRLLKIFLPLCMSVLAEDYRKKIEKGRAAGHYAIVFGLYAALLGIQKKEALTAFFYTAAAGMVTNSVKLIPLGQQDGQAILFSLHPLIDELALKSLSPDRELIGLCCTGFDIRSMQHEHLYSRLYMS